MALGKQESKAGEETRQSKSVNRRHYFSKVFNSSELTEAYDITEARTELPTKLEKELGKLEEIFTVDTQMLKKITRRFGEELEEGKP